MNGCIYRTEGGKCKQFSVGGVMSFCYLDGTCDCQIPSNADRIQTMSVEELAEWLADILNHCDNKKPEELCRISCPLYKCCNDQPSDNIEDWLKAPVEEVQDGT